MAADSETYLAREARARKKIDKQLGHAGWIVQGQNAINLHAGSGVAVREVVLEKPHGRADYVLFMQGKPVGVIEAKPEGTTLTEVEHQSAKYAEGLPAWMQPPVRPLPFIYESTGTETRFTNGKDPDARSRRVFGFHRPETLLEQIRQIRENPAAPTLRGRLRTMPELDESGLWSVQARAIRNLEESLREDRPRAVIQMATGCGKTFTAANISYRLIRHANAHRVLFLVDRSNLGRQTKLEFDKFVIPETQRKFPAEYIVQHLSSNTVDPSSRVCISTVQRIYSILRGDKELDPEVDEQSAHELNLTQPVPVEYSKDLPPEAFDVVIIDECHRSIYGLWRQVIEYFDAHLIGLTATPTRQTFGFFHQNLVMEYNHDQAVADNVNVDYSVYEIQTAISEQGGVVEKGDWAGYRNRLTRAVRWQEADEPTPYKATQLDRAIVATDQIRTVIKTFKDKLFTELFPGRTTVPKTLIFAKDDSHADDIVQIVREVFAKGNDFATKITYRTHDGKPDDLLQAFRNSMYPRIVVTVDMIATGTDVKPLECLLFMRSVKSRTYFEQMLGRGVRVIDDTDFQAVTDDAKQKDRFLVVDAVGVTHTPLADNVQPLDRKPAQNLDTLFKQLSFGKTDADIASTIAARLARLDKRITREDREHLQAVTNGTDLATIVHQIVDALHPDQQLAAAVEASGSSEPSEAALSEAAQGLLSEALLPLTSNPALRNAIVDVRKSYEQTIDEASIDDVIFAGYSEEGLQRARTIVTSFRQFIEEHKDDIHALEVLYSRPYAERLIFAEIKELAQAIQRPPLRWTPDLLWRAYEVLDKSKVRGSGARTLTDIVALVRYALEQDQELVPFRDQVDGRFAAWLTSQEQQGVAFNEDQLRWLTWIKESIASDMGIGADSFDFTPYIEHGGIGKAVKVFGDRLTPLMNELTEVLAA